VLLGVLHPDGGIEMALEHSEILIRSCHDGSQVGIGLAVAAQFLGVERELRVITLLGGLIDALRKSDVEALSAGQLFQRWNAIFRQWRQRSHAPVTASGKLEVWLA
jgi:hypothetical protein